MNKITRCCFILLTMLGCTRRNADSITVRTSAGHVLSLPLARTLRLSNFLHPFDWHAVDSSMVYNVMEGLVQYDFRGGEIKLRPALAESWHVANGGRRWTFHLRRDVRWSDGVPFRAQHLVDGWRRVLTRETASPVAYFLYGVKNARRFHDGAAPFAAVGIKVANEWDIEIELERPLSFFPQIMTDAASFPVRADLIEKFGAAWSDFANLVTLGPYRALDLNPDRTMVLARNETYYDAQSILHAPERVIAYHVLDEAPRRMFEAGSLDVVPSLGLDQERTIEDGPAVHRAPMLSVAYLGFGTKRKPFDDPVVRRAVARALDRATVSRVVGRGQDPLAGWIPRGALGFEERVGPTFAPDEARALLKKATLASPSESPRIELAIYSEADRDVAQNIQFQLKQNLGWTVEITTQDWRTLNRRFAGDPPSMFLTDWALDFPDPDNVFNLFTSFSGNNHTGWGNSAFDDLVTRAAGAGDPARRRALYHQAQVLLLEREVPALPLYSGANTTLTGPRVTAYPHNALGKIIVKDVRLSDVP